MEQANLGVSLKNVPLPSRKEYLLSLINAIEKFIYRVRWKVFFFLNPQARGTQKETYNFKTTNASPKSIHLDELESELHKMVKNIIFRPYSDEFQNKLNEYKTLVCGDEKLFVKGDKSQNFYKMDYKHYDTLLEKHIQQNYRKSNPNRVRNINRNDKQIAEDLDLGDRIHEVVEKQAFITIKDHKSEFQNKTQCRLLNPTKPMIGKISKQILENVNTVIREKTKFNQWINTYSTVEWFKSIQNKESLNFIQFDIISFYPSITEELLLKAIHFARQYTVISDEHVNIILSCKRSVLVHKSEPWEKTNNPDIDVTEGSFDGAETCELVGLFFLSLINDIPNMEEFQELKKLKFDVGLYRDDGLSVVRMTNRQAEKLKQQIKRIFNDNGLNITIEANKKIVDFLDVTFNLKTGEFYPYMKPNNFPLYVHAMSNHPPSVIKNIPLSINARLSSISSNEKRFLAAKPTYEKALRDSGYSPEFKYEPKIQNNTQKKTRKRKIIFFNPPYSKNVQTNVGAIFLKIIDKCFPKDNSLNKILNRNTVKISYKCTQNLQSIISAHNAKICKNNQNLLNQTQPECKCKETPCVLEEGCDTQNIVYQATVTQENSKIDTYVGLTSTNFSTRYKNHVSSMNNKKHSNQTKLSAFIWELKDQHIDFSISWKVIDRGKPFSPLTQDCQLCLKEKYHIIFRPENSTLNKRNELAAYCRHKKHSLLQRTK